MCLGLIFVAHHVLQFACAVVWIFAHAAADGMCKNLYSLERKCNEHPFMDLLGFDTIHNGVHRGREQEVETSDQDVFVRGNVATKPVGC